MQNYNILIINCGATNISYQLFLMPEGISLLKGKISDLGKKNSFLQQSRDDSVSINIKLNVKDHRDAILNIIDSITNPKYGILKSLDEINAVGHRVVHGGEKYSKSVIVTEDVINQIELLSDLAPLHNPFNAQGIKACKEILPDVIQTATFDTAFHQTIPDYAYIYALPYEIYEKYKIRKYGFHGTSHEYVAEKALEYCKMAKENTNIITCYLGNGSSITAIEAGKSCDTSMGFTPLEGLIMKTRSGDIDPAIIHYLMDKGKTDKEIIDILNNKSGLLGISNISDDINVLEKEAEKGNKKALLALNAFAYRAKKYIGAYAAIMVKVNILVFTGEIGVTGINMRERICRYLENIGIVLDKEKNKLVGSNAGIISTDFSRITIIVIPSNEEKKMAEDAYSLISNI